MMEKLPEVFYDLAAAMNSEKLIALDIGELNLPTGKIIASDPFFTDSVQPFRTKVKAGKYPVKIYFVKIEEHHHRVAFAKLIFSDSKAVKWKLAIQEGTDLEEVKKLNEGEYFGFPVDAGMGAFIDEAVNKNYLLEIDEFYRENADKNYYNDLLSHEFKVSTKGSPLSSEEGDWNNHKVKNNPNENIIMFSSGWGDGYYPVYWGLDQHNEIVDLIIDFMIDLDGF